MPKSPFQSNADFLDEIREELMADDFDLTPEKLEADLIEDFMRPIGRNDVPLGRAKAQLAELMAAHGLTPGGSRSRESDAPAQAAPGRASARRVRFERANEGAGLRLAAFRDPARRHHAPSMDAEAVATRAASFATPSGTVHLWDDGVTVYAEVPVDTAPVRLVWRGGDHDLLAIPSASGFFEVDGMSIHEAADLFDAFRDDPNTATLSWA